VTYRLRNGSDHRRVQMAVVVQRMVDARAAGVLFTADPVTSNRKIVSIEAVAGLGEALVEGWANPDRYQVRDGKVIAAAGQALSDERAVQLAGLGRRIEAHPEVVGYLQQVGADDSFIGKLPELDGGLEARDAILGFLDAFGMRCVGEIDVTRPRWSERPTQLLPMICGNVKNFAHGAARRRFEQGRRNSQNKEQELLARLRALPDGNGRRRRPRR
jgi:rifampicin phosphotransferase